MRYGMNINQLAKLVADDLKETMGENGFETFKEMKDCYWWTAQDVKNEICDTAQIILNDEVERDEEEYGEWENIPFTVRCYIDDCGHIEYGSREMKYGQFKKIVMSYL